MDVDAGRECVYTISRARTKVYMRYINIYCGGERDFTSLADYELRGNKHAGDIIVDTQTFEPFSFPCSDPILLKKILFLG